MSLRIAFLTPEFATEPYFAGGLAQHLGRVVPAMVERGHQVEVFVTSTTQGECDYHGARVWRVPPRRVQALRVGNGLLRLVGQNPLAMTQRACSMAKGLDRSLRRRSLVSRFDIIQAASWMASGFFSVRNPVAPVVVRVSSYGPLLGAAAGARPDLDQRTVWALELVTMRRASAVYAPSQFLAHRIFSESRLDVRVVRPPFYVDVESEDPSAARKLDGFRPYLLFFGRIARCKGAGLLSEAIKPLLNEMPDLHLAMAGPQAGDETVQELLGLEQSFPHQVRYLGILPPPMLRPVVRAAHAVVLPSLADNLPNTCLEAMGLGQLVIGPNGVSFDELITDGESGVLFELGSALSLRHAIARVWHMPDEIRTQMSQRARARLENVAPQRASAELESFYEQVIEKAGHAARRWALGWSPGNA